tara:strand:+ start:27887 stop:28102 length:216 start_codon:yes stop_codon:yes gene_type:complete
MGRKDNFWDNNCVGGFFSSLKVQTAQYEPLMNRDQIHQVVFEYIVVGFGRKKRHSVIGYLSFEQYEKLSVA